jgi:hypothetical protein
MARLYTVQPAERIALKAAIKHTRRKAKAAVGTNSHLELTQGKQEALELEGYCDESLGIIDRAVGDQIEFTNGQVMAVRSCLRIYGGALEKKEDENGDLLDDKDVEIAELRDRAEKVAKLLRVLSPQADAFEPAPVDAPTTPAEPETLTGEPVEDVGTAVVPYADNTQDIADADVTIITDESRLIAAPEKTKKKAASTKKPAAKKTTPKPPTAKTPAVKKPTTKKSAKGA